MTYFVALDIGATYIKSGRVDAKTFELSAIHRVRFPSFDVNADDDRGSYRTVEFAEILKSVVETLSLQITNEGKCLGILPSNQMHGLVLFSPAGNVVTPFFSWQDTRTLQARDGEKSPFEALREKTGPFSWNHETGEFLRPGFPIAQLFGFSRKGLLPKGSVPMDLGNAVITALSNAGQRCLDETNAAAMGCLQIATRTWHQPLISELGLSHLDWPLIVGEGTPVGTWSNRKIPLYPAIGDQQASLLGAGLSRPDQISVNIATGSQVSRILSQPAMRETQTRPYFRDKYLETITHIPAGRALNAWVRLFSELNPQVDFDQAWSSASALAEAAPDNPLAMNLALFPSAFGDRGFLHNIREEDLSVGSILRSALQSIARDHRTAWNKMNSTVPEGGATSYHELLGSGGVLKKSKILANALQKEFTLPLRESPHFEDALMGHVERAKQLCS